MNKSTPVNEKESPLNVQTRAHLMNVNGKLSTLAVPEKLKLYLYHRYYERLTPAEQEKVLRHRQQARPHLCVLCASRVVPRTRVSRQSRKSRQSKIISKCCVTCGALDRTTVTHKRQKLPANLLKVTSPTSANAISTPVCESASKARTTMTSTPTNKEALQRLFKSKKESKKFQKTGLLDFLRPS